MLRCPSVPRPLAASWLFFFNDTATTEIYPLSLHDALPISSPSPPTIQAPPSPIPRRSTPAPSPTPTRPTTPRRTPTPEQTPQLPPHLKHPRRLLLQQQPHPPPPSLSPPNAPPQHRPHAFSRPH